MGWIYTRGSSRQQVIAERTRSSSAAGPEGTTVTTTCLAHCYRGAVYSGVLWAVWERTYTRNGEEVKPKERWIACDSLHHKKFFGWGYRALREGQQPFQYSCPLAYLDMVPLDVYGGCKGWRDSVRRYYTRLKERQQLSPDVASIGDRG